ncbi:MULTISPECIES: DUF485 domain-containing protein [Paenibacillus]|uniref:Membrane protein n=1 Tax=Paenibacillus naphthalenovorans TaxID=162209 RepID=A0A0U2UQG2_9BACL|nr:MULTISPECIES: DUF485 domain-containing protein [Paenibacillus]ALS24289.1 membrane protein [Paenibacillus naphthalenovorans]NTZ20390.1 DUF485 domain-containing protein [Paenibacillus sp. JMULE4]GCL73820.1 DUF485 domain-containing protein [Paenibacillus naphthalenovorans]SDI52534.1 Uncharacterized membrane protein, DUF485 family [Paenibacillus naphthalenovorans]
MKKNQLTYSDIAHSELFRKLMDKKKRFIIPMTLFFCAFYFTLPFLTAFSNVLNTPAVGSITWAWVFAFAQFIMTWVLCSLYSKKSVTFDAICEEIKDQMHAEQRKAG